MSVFKVREKFEVVVWTTVIADSPEEAERKLNEGEGATDFENAVGVKHLTTDWKTLGEGKS